MRFHFSAACFLSLHISNALSAAGPAPEFDWSAVTPSPQLRFHKCYDDFECARLTVPRDWLDVEKNKTFAIAVIRLPASVPSSDPSFGGSIITNPGGPGGSGVSFLRRLGKNLQQITEGKKHYEIVSFDPRGIENTTPRAECFGQSNALARDAMILERRGIGSLDSSDSGLRRALALDLGYGALCESADSDEEILGYVSTASVARDILEISDQIEQLRQADDDQRLFRDDLQSPLRQDTKTQPSRVLYWGFSYGTVLGNTMASLYPGRMGRVILDGVVDIHDYMSGSWLRNLLDTEKIIQYFYDTCFEASGDCPLWQKGDASAKDIQSRIEKLIVELDTNPVSIISDDQTSSIRVITGTEIRTAFRDPAYRPLPTAFPSLAIALAEALSGNYSRIGPYIPSLPLQDVCGLDRSSPGDAQAAIACGDARYYNSEDHPKGADLTFWKEYITKLTLQSPNFAPFWANVASGCAGWGIVPKWGFKGPWTTPLADPSLRDDAPAAPILFTSSRLDPVTPLENAYRMSNAHPNSSVLVLDTVGHCATDNGWSECFNKAIRAYLDDGILPKNGTWCADTTCKPFVKGGECQSPVSISRAGADADGTDQSDWARQPLGFPLGFRF